jgi:HEAT repeat protein
MKDSVTTLLLLLILSGMSVSSQQLVKPSDTQPNETEFFIARFKQPEHLNVLQGAMWTVTHDYADFKKMSEKLKTFQTFFEAVGKYESGDPEPLAQVGGVKAFKETLSLWLRDDDQAIRSFAAVLIGISGDKAFAPQLATLIKERKGGDDEMMVYEKGRAAFAIGLLGAAEYTPLLVAQLESKNQYDRSGAMSALARFNATEHAPRIAKLLNREGLGYHDDTSPIHFLVETGTAKNYKSELLQTMIGSIDGEKSETAMYALVSLNAKESAPAIAKLLDNRFRKEDAAKALALLNATQYSDKIAALLKDESGLVRAAAALSLGVMKSSKHAKQVAALLSDTQGYVHDYAAAALLLMGAKEYYKEAYSVMAEAHSKNAYLTDSSFHPFVENKSRLITEELKKQLEVAKAAQ